MIAEDVVRCDVDAQGWVRCPVCGGKTRVKVLAGTELVNFPLYCPKCHRETIVDYPGTAGKGAKRAPERHNEE